MVHEDVIDIRSIRVQTVIVVFAGAAWCDRAGGVRFSRIRQLDGLLRVAGCRSLQSEAVIG